MADQSTSQNSQISRAVEAKKERPRMPNEIATKMRAPAILPSQQLPARQE
jgi:hypothetical protein